MTKKNGHHYECSLTNFSIQVGECNNERARKSLCRPKVRPKEFGAQPTSRSGYYISGSHNLPISSKLFPQQKYVNLPYHKNISRPEALHQEPTTKVLNSQRTITEASYTLVAVGSSGILKAKKKLGVTFNFDKQDVIDFTKFSKITMCRASEANS